MNKKLYALAASLFFIACSAVAQVPHWEWAKRGGCPTSSSSAGSDETVKDMATDKQGNVYVLSDVLSPGLNVDGHTRSGYGGYDIMLSSFTCDGRYRWSKMLGSNVQSDHAVAVKTDTLGGVYVIGYIIANATQLHIDADSVWTGGPRKDMFLAKFDSAGVYKWFRMPQADTSTAASLMITHAFHDLDVDGAGNIYFMAELAPGAYQSGAYVIATHGQYIVQYDRFGNHVNHTLLPITWSGSLGAPGFFMKRDHRNGRFYVTGSAWGIVMMGSTTVSHTLFVSCFSSTGACLWTRQNTALGGFGQPFLRPAVDNWGGIYLSGCAVNGDTFNSYPVVNPLGPNDVTLIVKMDSNGNNVWCKNAHSRYVCATNCVVVKGNEIAVSGTYTGTFTLPGLADTLKPPVGPGGYRIYYLRYDAATGTPLKLDSLGCPDGYFNEITAIAADGYGSVYVGGSFPAVVWLPGDTLVTAGGGSDFFFAKYGTANCTMPVTLGTTIPEKADGPIAVFPNPVTDQLTVSGIATATKYRLMTMTGAVLQTGMLPAGNTEIDMRHCSTGLYLLEVSSERGREVLKIVKQ